MFFSTIIPTYNRAPLLPAALDSALAQTFSDQEIIVVDAGSTDDTQAVLARYAGRVTVVKTDDCGPGAARNRGLALARGEYIAFLDSDDLWFPWTLESFHRAIRESQSPAFIAGSQVDFYTAEDPLPNRADDFRTVPYDDYLVAGARDAFWILPGAATIRAEVLRGVGGFAEGHINAEDSDLWLRIGTAAPFVRIESPPLFAYRRHAGGATSALDRTFRGSLRLVTEEKRGAYPGGATRQRERWKILTRHTRPASLACLRQGLRAEAWELFRATLPWNWQLGRLKYFAGFLLTAARGSSKQAARA